MNNFKLALRSMLALGSLMGFLISWITLAHAHKPVQSADPTVVAPLPTLAPLAPLPPLPSNNGIANGGNLNVISPTEAPLPTVAPFPTPVPYQPPVLVRRRRSIFSTGGS